VSRIFLSHSSTNNTQAVALYDWLQCEGWKDEVFLDFDMKRGIVAGERWERALNKAANRCEVVLFLVSKAWIASGWCRKELNLALRLNKRLFGVLIEDLTIEEIPKELSGEWQLVRLASGRDHVMLHAIMPITQEHMQVTFSSEGLRRLKYGLEAAGLDPKYFAWPPANDPSRSPYRGLRPFEADDAGIFFGRDAPVIEALDRLRGLAKTTPPRLLVILGASGAGKSSFLRAGLLPRLMRDDRQFLPLPIVRPERSAINGKSGLLNALEEAFQAAKISIKRDDLRAAIESGAAKLRPLLRALAKKATLAALDQAVQSKPPTLIVSIDQGEELFLAEGQDEATTFLGLLRELLSQDEPPLIVLFAIRSDSYERLQLAKELEGVRHEMLNLPPMPKGSYAEVIKGPIARLAGTERKVEIDESLVNALLTDIDAGGAKDALPLLAFTLERLYVECGASGRLRIADYEALGRIRGSIEAAVERAFAAADDDPAIPKDHNVRLALLRRGLIPWLAGFDPDSGSPHRRVARQSEIPEEARPLMKYLVDQRLLATDFAKETGEQTIEPAHEALLRQWRLLQGWLAEDAGLLGVLEGVKRASRDWAAQAKNPAWLAHATDRLVAVGRLSERPDLAANLKPTDREYLAACWKAESVAKGRRRRVQTVIYVLLIGVIGGLIGWINQSFLIEQKNWWMTMRSYAKANFWPYVLSAQAEHALKPQASFRECAKDCPEMIVIPAGPFTMGSLATEQGRNDDEGSQHPVTITKRFAVSKFDVTFADWDVCVSVGGCPQVSDGGMGRGTKPIINVTWVDAQKYVAWLAKMTGQPYRLLTEAEWEYTARAGTTTVYYWGDEIGKGNANCNGCGVEWEDRGADKDHAKQTSPVGSFKPNAFGLYDMAGNVSQWVEDCYHANYDGAPPDGSAWTTRANCSLRVVRGGSWFDPPPILRSAFRFGHVSDSRSHLVGFRVARTLLTD
jgi:formylglycine-generating enzyme required for sulfatase activity